MIVLLQLNEWPHVSWLLVIACAPGCRRRVHYTENPAPSPEMAGLRRVPQAKHVPCTSALSRLQSPEQRWRWAGAEGECEQKGSCIWSHWSAPLPAQHTSGAATHQLSPLLQEFAAGGLARPRLCPGAPLEFSLWGFVSVLFGTHVNF